MKRFVINYIDWRMPEMVISYYSSAANADLAKDEFYGQHFCVSRIVSIGEQNR